MGQTKPEMLLKIHWGTKGIILFFQKTGTLQSRGVVTLFHLFTITIYGMNCSDIQHGTLFCNSNIQWHMCHIQEVTFFTD